MRGGDESVSDDELHRLTSLDDGGLDDPRRDAWRALGERLAPLATTTENDALLARLRGELLETSSTASRWRVVAWAVAPYLTVAAMLCLAVGLLPWGQRIPASQPLAEWNDGMDSLVEQIEVGITQAALPSDAGVDFLLVESAIAELNESLESDPL
jgi:hypothetical protein